MSEAFLVRRGGGSAPALKSLAFNLASIKRNGSPVSLGMCDSGGDYTKAIVNVSSGDNELSYTDAGGNVHYYTNTGSGLIAGKTIVLAVGGTSGFTYRHAYDADKIGTVTLSFNGKTLSATQSNIGNVNFDLRCVSKIVLAIEFS